jgi:beta-lactamase regulating signal transducer with metallopeptidase domain
MIALGWALVLALWQTGATALAYRTWRAFDAGAPPSRRHRVALAGIVIGLAAGFGTVIMLGKAPGTAGVARPALVGPSVTVSPFLPTARADAAAALLPFFPNRVMKGLAVAWLAGIALLGVRLVGGIALNSRIRRRATLVRVGVVHEVVHRLTSRAGLGRGVDLLETDELDAPVTVGWRRPAILLPRSVASALPPSLLEPLLAHEIAHVRAHDYAANMVQSVADVLLFFCPGTRWLSREARLAREQARDDEAAGLCGSAVLYASALGHLAEVCLARQGQVAVGASGPSLAGRMRRLLEGETMRKPTVFQCLILGVALMLTAVTGTVVAAAAAGHAGEPTRGASPRAMPYGYGSAQGSPVAIEGISSVGDSVVGAVRVRNTLARGRVTGIAFANLTEGGQQPQLIEAVETPVFPVSLGPNESVELPMKLLPVMRARSVHDRSGSVWGFLAVTAVELAGGSRWSAPLRKEATTVREAVRMATPRLSRANLSREGNPTAHLCIDDDRFEYSEGAIVPILGEEGHLACCQAEGFWRECPVPGP